MSDLRKKLLKLIDELEELDKEEMQTVREIVENKGERDTKKVILKVLDAIEESYFDGEPVENLWLVASREGKVMAYIAGSEVKQFKCLTSSMDRSDEIKRIVLAAAEFHSKGDNDFPVCDRCGKRHPQSLEDLLKLLDK